MYVSKSGCPRGLSGYIRFICAEFRGLDDNFENYFVHVVVHYTQLKDLQNICHTPTPRIKC